MFAESATRHITPTLNRVSVPNGIVKNTPRGRRRRRLRKMPSGTLSLSRSAVKNGKRISRQGSGRVGRSVAVGQRVRRMLPLPFNYRENDYEVL
jgi:hypothetical protein